MFACLLSYYKEALSGAGKKSTSMKQIASLHATSNPSN